MRGKEGEGVTGEGREKGGREEVRESRCKVLGIYAPVGK